ncbi:MAG TPA: AraC family transcriptional regulator [Candidatus Gemmiger excrementipullorum]|uniref:AraC family transcriptional regulator n=1 Tax=Candidatus Gemmiger excrementipullorum TaxID=2838610 RepID=A0A9D1XZI7_9FIRM|nr:AraC family transcriptional regulator [Candidatus Gemmiger excrementipullorum]
MAPEKDVSKFKFHVFRDERFIDLNLYQFGWERTGPAHSYGPHARNHYLFHYIIAGRGVLLANDKEYEVGPGHGFLVVPGQITTYRSDQADPWEYTWLEFDGLRAHESLNLAGISGKEPVYTARSKRDGQLLQDEMLYIVNHNEASPTHLIAHGYLFLDQLVQSSANRQEGRERRLRDFYIKEALVFIDRNYQRDISIEEIAAVCGLNRSYFGKVFRDAVGESPQAYLLHYRMARAAQLLKETRLPIGEIAAQVNYPNQLHFSRAFKSVHGVPPREYRRTHFLQTK